MKKEKKEFRHIWLLLAGFCAAAGAVLILCLTFRAAMPDTVGRKLTDAEFAEVVGRNSPLTEYVYLSPNANFPREDAIRKLTIHHMAGDMTLEELGETFSQQDRGASTNYAVDSQGRVGLYVEEANQSWASRSPENDGQAVTIEVANDEIGGEWHVSDAAYERLIELCVDICRRNGIEELRYTGDETGNLTLHDMFYSGTECPGPYLKSRMEEIAAEVTGRLAEDSQVYEEKDLHLQGRRDAEAGILTEEQEQNLRDEAMAAAWQCTEFYRDAEVKYPGTEYSYIEHFSDEQRENVVKFLGGQGYVSVSDGINMENYREMEEFYAACDSGGDGAVTVYNIYKEGDIGARTFVHRDGKTQSFYVLIGWQEGGVPGIRDSGTKEVPEMKLTEKGYFIYTYAETVMHGSLREYYRVKPLSDKCRELTGRYIEGLSFVDYNMLAVNWDASNVEEILMPCMFEDIYYIYTGERLQTEDGRIAAETYERIMTTCFPVSEKQVREYCGYQADTDSYAYEMACSKQFPPFGEVVDYTQNRDGTITLYVDGVWPDQNSDCAFSSRIVVQPFEDGTFRYLSNSIEAKELELPGGIV